MKLRVTGFTLIELLIVMALIGVLGALFVTNYPGAQKSGRDTIRRSDLKQFQTAVEVYANKNNGFYPIRTTAVKPTLLCGAGNPLSWIATCKNDPKDTLSQCSGGTCQYQYITNAGGTNYGIWARLEKPSVAANVYYIVCSSGITKEGSTVPTTGNTCP